jgi:TatD related DNase
MGTSASSKGPAGGVPMVPPWVPDLPPTTPDGDGDASPPADNGGEPAELSPNQNADALPQAPVPDRPMAPAARFTGARRNLGSFAKTGNSGDMRRGLGQYVRSGYGGARTATRRFGGTASTAGALRGALYALAQGQPAGPDGQLNRTLLQGRSAREKSLDAGTPVLHWFSGGLRDLERAIKLGCWFSVGPAMLASENGRTIAARMPRDRVLTESDGPFAHLNGNPLYPWEVETAIDQLSAIWSLKPEEVQQAILSNLRALVG